MIVLKQLTWDNCFSYGTNNTVDFSKSTITQLLGENGHGKSSVILILQEVLYGKNSKGIKKSDILNRNTTDTKYSITLTLEIDGIEYTIKHSRKGASITLALFKKQEDISEHTTTNTYKKIETLLGLTFEDFCQLVYQSSESSLEFLKATDTTRKKFLISLLGLQHYTDLEIKIKNVITEVTTQRVALESSINTINTWLNKLLKEPLTPMELQEVPNDPENLREEIANLRALAKEQDKIKKQISSNNAVKQRYAELQKILAFPPEDSEEHTDEIVSTLATAKAELFQQKARRKEYVDIKEICPTCKRKFEGIDRDFALSIIETCDEAIIHLGEKIATLEAELVAAKNNLKLKKDYNTALQEAKLLVIDETLADTFEDLIGNKPKILQYELDEELTRIANIKKFNSTAEKHNERIALLKRQEEEYRAQLVVEVEQLEKIKAREARLSVLKQAFSTKGLIAYKIESMIKDLETLINEYLAEFSNGRFTIEFVVSNDKLNVVLTDNGKEIGIVALSSGELARVNTSTLLAIRKLLNSLSSNKLNLLFLDEVLNVLDEDGRQKLISVLSEEEDLNSFIVSHGWYHPLVTRMRVLKTEGISTVMED